MAKCIFERQLPGTNELILVSATTPAGTLAQQAAYVKAMVDGKATDNKFWWFDSIPSGQLAGCDFSAAPQIPASPDNTIANIQALIEGITAQPTDVLTYLPE